MKLDALIREPIFQLNLLLWMARDQPAQSPRVVPLFFRWGYRFIMVENPVPLPPATVAAVNGSGLEISVNPEPEMILGHPVRSHALYLEAKKQSFSARSSTARQARGHLLAAGDAFKEIVAPYLEARLCYVLPEDQRKGMEECLEDLKTELRAKRLLPGTTSVHGMEATAKGIAYVWDSPFATLVEERFSRALILESEGDDTDPSPLLLVYSAEDYSGDHPDYAREAMIKQVWAVLLCGVHASEPGSPYQTKADAILTNTTDKIFNFLGRERQKSLCRLVTKGLFVPIRDYWNREETKRDDIQVALNGSALTIILRDELAKTNFTDWLEEAKKVRPEYSALPTEEQTAFEFEKPKT